MALALNRSILFRLAIIMAILTLTPVATLGVVGTVSLRRLVHLQLERELTDLTRNTARRLARERALLLESAARQRVVEQTLLVGEDTNGALALYLDGLVGTRGTEWSDVTVLDPDGRVIARSRGAPPAVEARGAAITVVTGAHGERLLQFVTAVHPAFDPSATVGTMVARATPAAVAASTRATLAGSGFDLALLDGDGPLWLPGVPVGDRPRLGRRLASLGAAGEADLAGRRVVGSAAPLTDAGSGAVRVVVFTETARAFALVRVLTSRSVALVAAAGLLGLPLCVLVAFWFTRRIVRLGDEVSADTSGPIEVEGRDEIAELALALNRYRADVQARARAHAALTEELRRSQFINMMSHELRTPLASIIALNDLVLADVGDALPGDAHESLELVGQSAQALLQIVNNVLEMSRLQAGHLSVARANLDLEDLVEDCVGMVRVLVRERPIELRARVAPEARRIVADPGKLRQVLVNLLSNAAKFTAAGEIVVTVAAAGGAVRIDVTDSGPGIPVEVQRRIFEPFEQAEQGANRRGGTGLGLSLSHRLVELMGGGLSLRSAPGQGSTFTVDLPGAAIQRRASSPDFRAPALPVEGMR